MKKEHLKQFGEFIALLRKTKNISQKKMAADLEMETKELRAIEHFKLEEIPKGFSKKAAKYFGIPVSALAFGALSEKDMKKPQQKKFYKAAKPIIGALIKYLVKATK